MSRIVLSFALFALLLIGNAMAATEEAESTAIDNGLAWLAGAQTINGAEGYWPYGNDGTLATTASAALAFIEEGYYPGDGSMYDDVITRWPDRRPPRTSKTSGFCRPRLIFCLTAYSPLSSIR